MAQNNKTSGTALTAPKSKKPLCKHTEEALDSYFASLNGDRHVGADFVLHEASGCFPKHLVLFFK